MATQDFSIFTDFLGKDVHFTIAVTSENGVHWEDLFLMVEGKITEVRLKEDLEHCQFVIDDTLYNFGSVNFIDIGFNPVHDCIYI